jgi:putative membrane protein
MTNLKKNICRASLGVMVLGLLSFASAQDSNSSMSPSMGKSAQSSGLTAADKKFVMAAADGGMAEVELGQLAVEKGSSDDVKKFGQRMVDDHSKANDQLKQLAASKGVDLPQDVSAKDKATKARLSKLSGDQFDKAYMADMVQDHKKDVADFKKESQSGKDTDIKNFASQTLPTLQDHLKQAQSIAPNQMSQRSAMEPSASQR